MSAPVRNVERGLLPLLVEWRALLPVQRERRAFRSPQQPRTALMSPSLMFRRFQLDKVEWAPLGKWIRRAYSIFPYVPGALMSLPPSSAS
jgi:hypothetical protein